MSNNSNMPEVRKPSQISIQDVCVGAKIFMMDLTGKKVKVEDFSEEDVESLRRLAAFMSDISLKLEGKD